MDWVDDQLAVGRGASCFQLENHTQCSGQSGHIHYLLQRTALASMVLLRCAAEVGRSQADNLHLVMLEAMADAALAFQNWALLVMSLQCRDALRTLLSARKDDNWPAVLLRVRRCCFNSVTGEALLMVRLVSPVMPVLRA